MADTLRDRFWIWGHEAGSYHRLPGNPWHLPGPPSRLTPAEAADDMGIPNVMMVRFGNRPRPPFREPATPLRSLRRQVWSIVGDAGSTDNDREPDLQSVLDLASEFPNLSGAIMDDFFRKDPARPGRYSADQVDGFRRRLHDGPRPLDLYAVTYTHNLDLPIADHLAAVDATTFWTWHGSQLWDLEASFGRLEALAPGLRKLLGIYLWDFGAAAPLPPGAMAHQCRLGLEWLRSGRVEGLVFLASCLVDCDIEAVHEARRLIAAVGDETLSPRA